MSKHTVLFELGCEELPPKSLKTLRDALQAETVKGLNEAGLNFADPALSISWPLPVTDISPRDLNHAYLPTDYDGIQI